MPPIHTTHGKFPGQKLHGKEQYKRLYHYTSFDTFVRIWLTKKLLFSDCSRVNDIQEASFSTSIYNLNQAPLMCAFINLRKEYRQISLTMDNDSYLWGCMSTMMWGHYGDKGKGVCIELDFDKLNLSKDCFYASVKYVNYLPKTILLDPNLKTIKDLRKYISKNKRALFFTKQKRWEGEKEFRIVSNTEPYLDISNAITAVYVTDYESNECILTEQLVNGAVPVKCLRFTASPKNNLALPILVERNTTRERTNETHGNPQNFLKNLQDTAYELYMKHKDDEDFPLIIPSDNTAFQDSQTSS